jgi:hypothetical protein
VRNARNRSEFFQEMFGATQLFSLKKSAIKNQQLQTAPEARRLEPSLRVTLDV